MKNPFYNRLKNLTVLQLQTINRLMWSGICIVLIESASIHPNRFHIQNQSLLPLVEFLALIPMLGILYFVGRYLALETDEFVRTIVVKSILWAAAVIIVVDTLQSALVQWNPAWSLLQRNEIASMNLDIFAITAGLAFAFQIWRNR